MNASVSVFRNKIVFQISYCSHSFFVLAVWCGDVAGGRVVRPSEPPTDSTPTQVWHRFDCGGAFFNVPQAGNRFRDHFARIPRRAFLDSRRGTCRTGRSTASPRRGPRWPSRSTSASGSTGRRPPPCWTPPPCSSAVCRMVDEWVKDCGDWY